MRTQFLGPDDLLVAAKVESRHAHRRRRCGSINEAEARVRAVVPYARPMCIEPDFFGDPPAEHAERGVA